VDQEKYLIIISRRPYEHQREMLFLKETNDHIVGRRKLTKERALA
jgi:Xaa-Pro aminopeptidase